MTFVDDTIHQRTRVTKVMKQILDAYIHRRMLDV